MKTETESVRVYLSEALQPLGFAPDSLYVNEIADVIDREVVRSLTLVEATMHHLELGEEPTYDQGLFGLFHQPHTFDPALRVNELRLPDFERMIGDMLLAMR